MLYDKTTNFNLCMNTYLDTWPLYRNYSWNGSIIGIERNQSHQISYEGCRAVCGTGNDRYPWSNSSQTITTWLLPIVGMLLQAPFMSNAFWSTVLLLCRWLGSPMSSLACILWNISVSGKCAMMVDMSVKHDQPALDGHVNLAEQQSDFDSIRDSFYILLTMNQYSIKTTSASQSQAEGLLRIVLFSKDLRMHNLPDKKLRDLRKELARSLRQLRRRNAVPVFISTLWFLFALAVSIQAAFDKLGDNESAHDLAMGLLLAWLPILVLSSIVDCGSVAANSIRQQMNDLINLVCESLQDPPIYQEFIDSFRDRPEFEAMQDRVKSIRDQAGKLQGNFFKSFAGQGRVRWHYGAGHPILSDIENCYVAEHGRNWLANEEEARTNIVLGSLGRGLFWFDFREGWQIMSAMVIVGGSCLGGAIVSYFTPTVGLGCRSRGYLVYAVVAISLVVVEFLVWYLTSFSPEDREQEQQRRDSIGLGRSPRLRSATFTNSVLVKETTSWAVCQRNRVEIFLLRVIPLLLTVFTRGEDKHARQEELRKSTSAALHNYYRFSLRQHLHYQFFLPLEIFNTVWLVYILLAQTFGFYVNCRCKSSMFGLGGGYVDLVETSHASAGGTRPFWVAGTVTSCSIMAVGATYIVLEWCLQSHLGTENKVKARKGLAKVRAFRRTFFWLRYPLIWFVLFVNGLRDLVFRAKGAKQRTLMWSRDVTYRGPKIASISMAMEKERGLDHDDGIEKSIVHVTAIDTPSRWFDDAIPTLGRPPSMGSTNEVFSTPRNSLPPR